MTRIRRITQYAIRTTHHALRRYWPLIKSLQTGLLLATGVAGYLSAVRPAGHWLTLLGLAGSLFLAISGSTVLNMAYDRDIDACMKRTCWRPLPTGQVSVREAVVLGLVLSALGVGWALAMLPLYGAIVFAGLFFDVVVYTIWLKRRTPYSIIIGGLAGGMPVLAGRTLAVGQIDTVGVMLALGVLFWIPTHIMTFSMRHFDDYKTAGRADLPGRVRVLRHPRHHRRVEPGRGADHGLGRGGHRRQAGAAGGVGCPGPWPAGTRNRRDRAAFAEGQLCSVQVRVGLHARRHDHCGGYGIVML